MKKLPLKYSERAIFPNELVKGDAVGEEYELSGGEHARFTYLMGVDVGRNGHDEELSAICKRIYGMTFLDVREVWEARLGRALAGVWHYVEMVNQEKV